MLNETVKQTLNQLYGMTVMYADTDSVKTDKRLEERKNGNG